MDFVIDVEAIQAISKEHSDNKHIIRRDDLKMGLVSVRPHDVLPIHTHDHEDQLYYVLEGEGTIRMDDQEFELAPGKAVTIPPGVAHGVRNTSDKPLRYLDILIRWKT
jgi:mannose-6-phosphate isomerase-like protein (cupin superfamily)